jgi:Tfp pilus assembly protein PilZ
MLSASGRRRDHRFELAIPLVFWSMNAPAELSYSAKSINISERGICFKTNHPMDIGLRVRVMLNIPERFKLSCKSICQFTGRVAHVEPTGFAYYSLGVGVMFYYSEPVIDQICEDIRVFGDSLLKAKTDRPPI